MTIVCPTDLSYASAPAEEQALRMARAFDAEVLFVHVVTEAPLYAEGSPVGPDVRAVYEGQRRWAAEELKACATRAAAAGVRARSAIMVGAPAAEIVRTAGQEKAELIVMGTHGRHGLNRALLGSVAEQVIRTAPCPVLTARTPGEVRGARSCA